MLDKKCTLVDKILRDYNGFFNSAYCSIQLLQQFFDKLKDLGIYDKTKIIIVSDHGAGNTSAKDLNIIDETASALMLVKDFNATGNLATSMQFLSNSDTYGIALSGVSGGAETQLDPIKNPTKNRSLIYVKQTVPWYSYNITKAFKVKKNIFKNSNWQELNSEQIRELGR